MILRPHTLDPEPNSPPKVLHEDLGLLDLGGEDLGTDHWREGDLGESKIDTMVDTLVVRWIYV